MFLSDSPNERGDQNQQNFKVSKLTAIVQNLKKFNGKKFEEGGRKDRKHRSCDLLIDFLTQLHMMTQVEGLIRNWL